MLVEMQNGVALKQEEHAPLFIHPRNRSEFESDGTIELRHMYSKESQQEEYYSRVFTILVCIVQKK